jgi:hypothetical protein
LRLQKDQIVLSPSDLMRFWGCNHATALDLRRLLGEDLQPAEDSADMALLQDKGAEHESRFLETLRKSGHRLIEIVTKDRSTAKPVAETKAALQSGPDYIYQAALSNGRWAGFADFLERVERPSLLSAALEWRHNYSPFPGRSTGPSGRWRGKTRTTQFNK